MAFSFTDQSRTRFGWNWDIFTTWNMCHYIISSWVYSCSAPSATPYSSSAPTATPYSSSAPTATPYSSSAAILRVKMRETNLEGKNEGNEFEGINLRGNYLFLDIWYFNMFWIIKLDGITSRDGWLIQGQDWSVPRRSYHLLIIFYLF